MTMSNLCAKETIYHVGKEKDFGLEIKESVLAVVDNDKQFQAVVSKAMKEYLTFEQAQKLYLKLINKYIGLSRTEKILEKIGISVITITDKNKPDQPPKYTFVREKGSTLKKWDLYNAVTNYISHDFNKTLSGKDYLFRVSEKILLDEI